MNRFLLMWIASGILVTNVAKAQGLSENEVKGWLRGQALLSSSPEKWTWELFKEFGFDQPYSKEDLKEFSENAPLLTLEEPKADEKKPQPFFGIKVRQDSQDVVASEDPTVESPRLKRNQLKGATFNFTHDFLSDGDIWSVRGALIRPFKLTNEEGHSTEDGWRLDATYLIPSVSLNKVSNDVDPKAEVDSLVYRLGASTRLSNVSESTISELEFRGFGTYGTDTSHDSSIVAGEFDIEPRLAGRGEFAKYALGYQASLGGRAPTKDDKGTSHFFYSLRAYLHGEFGEVRDNGGNAEIETGDFFRLGPTLRLEATPSFFSRSLGLKGDSISLNASYAYLPSISGTDVGHDSHFSAGLDFLIWKDKADESRKFTFKTQYEVGGLELTKQEVEALTVGFGLTF